MRNVVFIILFISVVLGCNNVSINKQKEIAYFDKESIYLSEIDNSIKMELYDHLYEIYELRKKALDNLIRKKAFERNNEDYLLGIDSIYVKYQIDNKLNEPTAPKFLIDSKDIYYKGNKESPNTLIIIKNFECDACRLLSSQIEELYQKYSKNIRFGYIHYSEPNLASKALEFARVANKHDVLFDVFNNYSLIMDSLYIYDNIEKIGLDTDKFNEFIKRKDVDDMIFNKYIHISEKGIRRIPTILFNGKLIRNTTSLEELESVIKKYI